MLEQARAALGDRARYVTGDLNGPLPAARGTPSSPPLRSTTSPTRTRRALFARVHEAFRPAGSSSTPSRSQAPLRALEASTAHRHEQAARALGATDAEWAGALERCATTARRASSSSSAGCAKRASPMPTACSRTTASRSSSRGAPAERFGHPAAGCPARPSCRPPCGRCWRPAGRSRASAFGARRAGPGGGARGPGCAAAPRYASRSCASWRPRARRGVRAARLPLCRARAEGRAGGARRARSSTSSTPSRSRCAPRHRPIAASRTERRWRSACGAPGSTARCEPTSRCSTR